MSQHCLPIRCTLFDCLICDNWPKMTFQCFLSFICKPLPLSPNFFYFNEFLICPLSSLEKPKLSLNKIWNWDYEISKQLLGKIFESHYSLFRLCLRAEIPSNWRTLPFHSEFRTLTSFWRKLCFISSSVRDIISNRWKQQILVRGRQKTTTNHFKFHILF